jgi:hypothetical protein
MNNLQKRYLLFLFGCIPTRLLLVYIAKYGSKELIKLLAYISLIISFTFMYLYLTNKRQTGVEVFGDKIWWNKIRPIHSIFYLLFAIYVFNNNPNAWIFLLIDAIFGLLSFIFFHTYLYI